MLRSRLFLGALLACTLLFSACGEGRSSAHGERAQELLAEGQLEKALIELHTAFQLDPDNADYANRIAELLLIMGESADARFYYGEAYRLDPRRFQSAIRLATMQFAINPEESQQLIEDVASNGPDSAWGEIGRSELARYNHDLDAALEHANRGVEIEPDNADAHWQIAIALTSLIRERTSADPETTNARFTAALAALDRFAELAPARGWRALAEKAQIYTAWDGHDEEAQASLREASSTLGNLGLLRPEFGVLDRALAYARGTGNVRLEDWALERKIERLPQFYPAWEELAALYDLTFRSGRNVYLRLIESFPDEIEPLVLSSRYTRRTRGRRQAIQELEQYIAQGRGAAPLLVEIAQNQSLLGKRTESLETIARLNAQYPNSRESVVMNAWSWLQARKPEICVEVLSEHKWADEDESAQRLLVDAYTMLADHANVVASLERLFKVVPDADLLTRRRYAQALFDDHRYHAARDAYREIQASDSLQPDELARYAVSLLESSATAVGRRMLESAVDQPQPTKLALLALYEREGTLERHRDRLRKAFQTLIEIHPSDPALLTAYVGFEVSAGAPNNALAPVERALADARTRNQPQAGALTLKATLQNALGDRVAARKTALEILDLAPSLPGVLEFAQSLYTTRSEAQTAIAELTRNVKNEEQTAQRHALLGRLYYRADNPVMARWSYEQALTGGLELPILKNDLAFLLAAQSRDLNRAKVLALQASQAMPQHAGVLDTLGYVLLQLEDYEGAVTQLLRGLTIARNNSSPQAELHYHLALAYEALDRMTEAESALTAALDQGEDFPDKQAAETKRAKLRGEI